MPLTLGPYSFRVILQPVSPGTLESDSTLVYDSVAHNVKGLGSINSPRVVTLTRASNNQLIGLLKYLALIKHGGTDTGSIETAIDAVL